MSNIDSIALALNQLSRALRDAGIGEFRLQVRPEGVRALELAAGDTAHFHTPQRPGDHKREIAGVPIAIWYRENVY